MLHFCRKVNGVKTEFSLKYGTLNSIYDFNISAPEIHFYVFIEFLCEMCKAGNISVSKIENGYKFKILTETQGSNSIQISAINKELYFINRNAKSDLCGYVLKLPEFLFKRMCSFDNMIKE